jgi:hypothetical protein
MALYRNLSIKNIMNRMGNVMGVGSLWEQGQTPVSSSGVEARDRLGWGPLRWLTEKLREWLVETYREAMSWKGMLVLALDGTTFKVPDSDENRRRFGLPGASRGRAAFPQMRALFLVSTKLRFILGARFAPYGRAEIHLAMRRIRSAALLMAAAPTVMLPAIFSDLIRLIGQCLLPTRHRRNPRHVCVKMSAYKLKVKPKIRRRTA